MAGNGNGKHGWSLAKDGILWKSVVQFATKEIKESASELIAQLQETLRPVDAIQGLLLDRLAAGYLRKQHLMEVQAAAAELERVTWIEKATAAGAPSRGLSLPASARNHHLTTNWAADLLRYESLLDQAFHRDLILLQQLREAPLAAQPANTRKSSQAAPKLIEGRATGQVV